MHFYNILKIKKKSNIIKNNTFKVKKSSTITALSAYLVSNYILYFFYIYAKFNK